MPRAPEGVTLLATCPTQWQAETIARYHVPDRQPELDDPPISGEDDYVVRVRPVGGEWRVERWSRRALMWEAEDESDVPF